MDLSCELCREPGGELLWQSEHCRIIRVADPAYPGFCRVIWRDHVREMTDLSPADRQMLMEIVFIVESVVKTCFQPDKINLAAFGNMVPHLHWHIIPRWREDKHFPEPIWGKVARPEARPAVPDVPSTMLAARLTGALADAGYGAC